MRRSALNGLTRRLSSLAADYDTAIGARSVLVVAPHPDDESIGCGGLMTLARQRGADVQIAFATYGDASHQADLIDPAKLREVRRKEACEAAARLGVPESGLHFLGVPDGHVREHQDALAAALLKILEQQQPDAVFLPHAKEPPPDHYLTLAAGRRALETWAKAVKMFEYGVWYWQHWPWVPLQLSPRAGSRLKWRLSALRNFGAAALTDYNCRLDISSVLPTKKSAIEAHASQFGGGEFSTDWPTLSQLEDGLIVQSWLQEVESFRLTQLPAR
jgi:LmbE family N-acetylglucosaminyl deacetylase